MLCRGQCLESHPRQQPTVADEPDGHAGHHPRLPEQKPHYGLVLLAIILAILIIVFAPDTTITRFLATVIVGAALLLALRSAQASPRLVRHATALLGVAAVGALGAVVTGRDTNEFSTSLTLILVGLTPVVLAARLVRNPEVSAQSLIGAACVYLLMGLFFGLVYSLLPFVTGTQFFTSTPNPTSSDYVYFSYITIATVGYGDLVPGTTLGRMLAVTEALTGQLYLVTVVALLVSNYRPRSRGERGEG
jgi:hypothetical protein